MTTIISDFQTYIEVRTAIDKTQRDITDREKELSDLERSSDSFQQRLSSTNAKLDSTLRQITDLEVKLSQMPELARQLNEVTLQIAETKLKQSELLRALETDKTDTARIANELNRHRQAIENLRKSAFDIQVDSYPKELEKQYENLRVANNSV